MISRKITVVAVVVFASTVLWPQASQAYSFTDNAGNAFNNAPIENYSGTTLKSNQGVQLSLPQTSGTFTSTSKDAGRVVAWDTLSWIPQLAYGKAMPNYGATETGYGYNLSMNGNVLLLHLDEDPASKGSPLLNSSGQAYMVNLVTDNGSSKTVLGKFKNGLGLDGNGDYVTVDDADTLDVDDQASWSAWIKPGIVTSGTIISKRGGNTANVAFGMQFNSGNNGCFGSFFCMELSSTGSDYKVNAISSTVFILNAWNHVVVTFNRNTSPNVTMYVNGTAQTLTTKNNINAPLSNSSASVFIGATYATNPNYFKGTIDEVAMFNRALTSNEVTNLYQRGVAQLKFQTRSCADATCSGGEKFTGPDGAEGTFYNDVDTTTNAAPLFIPAVVHNQFMQYQATLTTSDTAITPQLNSVDITASVPLVDWSQCKVQQKEVILASGQAARDIHLDTALKNSTKAFLLVNSTGDSAIAKAKDHLVSGYIKDNTTLTFERGGTDGDAHLSYALTECMLAEFTVQRGDIMLGNSFTVATKTLPQFADYGRSLVMVSSSTTDASATEKNGLVTGMLGSDNKTITVQRAGDSGDTRVRYEVVTFSTKSGVMVDTSTNVVNFNGATSTSAILNITAPPSQTWLYCSWDADGSSLNASAIGCNISNDGTKANFYRYTAAGGPKNRIRYYAVVFPENTVTALSGITPVDNPNSDTYNSTISLSPQLNTINKAFAYVTNTTAGTGTEFPRQRWLATLTTESNLNTTLYRGDPAGNTDMNYKYWQVIEFPLYSQALGYGWIGNAADECVTPSPTCGAVGFISYNSDNVADADNQSYGVQLENGNDCGANCLVKGHAWAGNYDTNDSVVTGNKTLGWMEFRVKDTTSVPNFVQDSIPDTIKNKCASVASGYVCTAYWNEITGELSGWARWTSIGNYGSIEFTQNDWGWIKLQGNIVDSATGLNSGTYGVRYDLSTRHFSSGSWAWSGNHVDSSTGVATAGSGIGWIDFDVEVSDITRAWLQTLYADVYAREGFDFTSTNTAPTGQYNATYLIQADGDVTNFISEYGTKNPKQYGTDTTYGTINAPVDTSADNKVYRGAIGTMHVSELIEQAKQENTAYNSCDALMAALKDSNDTNVGIKAPLDGKIFYCKGTLNMNSNLLFINGQQGELGNGTIVVDGDIEIRANTYYCTNIYSSMCTTTISNVYNTMAVAWIATGNITIEPNVSKAVGAFIALGDLNDAEGPTFSTSGTSQLEISGLVLARKFSFQRSTIGDSAASTPAEKIMYDSRLFANPPPGLEDLAKGLPVIQ